MFNCKLEEIFTPQRLSVALDFYRNRIRDYDEVLKLIESGKFVKELQKGYIPKPVKSFQIPKNENETREIILASTASKIIQKILVYELNKVLKFSNKSYAYRQGKGVITAINRTKDFLYRYNFVVKVDIDDFFDTIDQEILIKKVDTLINDKRIVKLIALFLKNGMLRENRWIDKNEGIYQGDVFAPLLSNIYLDAFDRFLENKEIDFVRFSDDILLFANSHQEAKDILKSAQEFIYTLHLRFDDKKQYIAHKNEGFVYLGLRFKGKQITMDNDRLMKKISTLSKSTKNQNLIIAIESINKHVKGVRNYYARVLSNFEQFNLLQEHVAKIMIDKAFQAKKTKFITRKNAIRNALLKLDFYIQVSQKEKNHIIDTIVTKAYEKLTFNQPLIYANKEITKSKSNFLKSQIKSSEIVLSRFGLSVGVRGDKIVIKEKGKLIKQVPINVVTRVIVLSRGVSLSAYLIYHCSAKKIDIDFIYHDEPYAMITYNKSINNELHLRQLEIKNRIKGLALARVFIKTKTKNQINLIKYYAKYREKSDKAQFDKLQFSIEAMLSIFRKIQNAQSANTLMGFEGAIAVHYWRAYGLLLGDEEHTRVARGAQDSVNQAINYGYAIIYNRVQSALLKAGLNIYISFLHQAQSGKPTLVYDLIEEFRQPVVDREILSILNKGTKLTSANGKLTGKSIKLIVRNIQERLATPSKSRYGKMKIEDIIEMQAYHLKSVINGTEKYKGFTAKY